MVGRRGNENPFADIISGVWQIIILLSLYQNEENSKSRYVDFNFILFYLFLNL